ncbi:cytochrome P450 [Crossiella cryophila]|uniref:Cytochrome P450 n=1 Tax=Crossiella cryophila TaxID=43355 RepID=A0A7W7CC50_9PSEU|nr:cytochrome P450 [Crossiella cryophila]MBB4678287.1 cytochrome P450 [Crossiella cryophila]
MTETIHLGNGLPTARDTPLDPPEVISRLRAQAPIARFTYPDGHEGWIVTGHAQARAILADSRFSSRLEYVHAPVAGDRAANFDPSQVPPGMFNKMDAPEHTRFRKQLAGQFTARRMNQLTERVTEIAEEHAKAMLAQGPPADLVSGYALPIPSLVICELLGIPYGDRESFQADISKLMDMENGHEEAMAAVGRTWGYVAGLVHRRRSEPSGDLLSDLVAAGELTDPELTGAAIALLIAGYETSSNMIALGTYTLLTQPDQLAALRADPSLVDGAVEELLRYLTVLQVGTERAPLEDVEIDGVLMKAGETALIHLPAANRDPARFADPDRLDITRTDAGGHLALGHGIHQCLGHQLARIELRIAYSTLLSHFPDLRLAVPAEEIELRPGAGVYGAVRLPITW